MKPVIIVLIIICGFILLFSLFLFYIYYKIFLMTKRQKLKGFAYDIPFGSDEQKEIVRTNAKKLEEVVHQDVYIKSYDGITLHGYYYHINDNSPLEIDFHGYKGQAFRDFSGGALMALDSGYNLLLVEERAHGYSGGHTISFGIKERNDVKSWVSYANNLIKDNQKIILAGISMGAATVLMASSLDLDNVVGIVADCPYSAPKDIILNTVKNMNLNPKLLYPFIYLSALIFGHFRLNQITALDAVKESKYPILLIHGEDDSFVPFEMGKEIAIGNKSVEFYSFPFADHGLSYLVDTDRYKKIVNNFIDKILYKED